MHITRMENSSFLVLFAAVSILLSFVFAPFFPILSLAAVSAVLLHRPYENLTRSLKGWKSFASLLTVVLVLIFFIVPLFFLGVQIFQEAQNLYAHIYGNGPQYMHTIQSAIESPVQRLFPGFVFNVDVLLANGLGFISNNLGSLVYQTFFVIFDVFLMLLALFFFLRDGRSLLASLTEVSPLGKGVTVEILDNMYRTIRSVIEGTLYNALIRWLCIGAAFYVFGIPNAVLWSSIGGIVGAIPGLGTPFAFIPAIIYLYLQGNLFGAAGLAVVGVAVVILVDNILTSYFFGKGINVSPVFVLFSILGGIVFLGPLGFIIGPLVLSVFVSVIRVYRTVERESTLPV